MFAKRGIITFLLLIISILAFSQNVDSLFVDKFRAEQLTDSTDQQRFAYLFAEGLRHKQHQQYDSAFVCFESCLRYEPENAAVYCALASATSDVDSIFRYMQRAVDLAPEVKRYQITLASMYISENRFEDAIAIYQNLLRKYPTNEHYLYMLSELYGTTENYSKRLAMLQRMEKLQGVTEENTWNQVAIYIMQNKAKAVEKQLQKLIRRHPYNMDYRVRLGDVYLYYGKNEKALNYFHTLLDEDPENGFVLAALAECYNVLDEQELVDEYMLKALADRRLDIDEHIDWLRSHMVDLTQKEAYAEADTLLDRMLALHPDDEALLDLQVRYSMHKGDTIAAKRQLRHTIELYPENEKNWQTYFELHDTYEPSLLSFVEEALQFFPTSFYWHFWHVNMLLSYEHDADLLQAIDDAIQQVIDKSSTTYFYTLKGDFMQHNHQYATAIACYEQALAVNSTNAEAQNNYAYLLACCNSDLKRAEMLSSEAVKSDPTNGFYLDTYARVLFMRGEYLLARFYQERAIAYSEVTGAEWFEHYGDILFMLGETDMAVEQWRKAAEFDTESVLLQQKIENEQYIPNILKIDDDESEK